MGTARVKQPCISNGLAFSRRLMSRSRPWSVRFGNQAFSSSRMHSADSMTGLLQDGRRKGWKGSPGQVVKKGSGYYSDPRRGNVAGNKSGSRGIRVGLLGIQEFGVLIGQKCSYVQ